MQVPNVKQRVKQPGWRYDRAALIRGQADKVKRAERLAKRLKAVCPVMVPWVAGYLVGMRSGITPGCLYTLLQVEGMEKPSIRSVCGILGAGARARCYLLIDSGHLRKVGFRLVLTDSGREVCNDYRSCLKR